jgi:hypothetical protein
MMLIPISCTGVLDDLFSMKYQQSADRLTGISLAKIMLMRRAIKLNVL